MGSRDSKYDERMRKTRFCLYIAFDLFCLAVIYSTYALVGYFADMRYLRWVEASNSTSDLRLSDAIHNFLPESWNSRDTPIATIKQFPPFVSVIAFVATLSGRHTDLFNFLTWCQVFMMTGKSITEHATIIPSSKAYVRCLRYLGIAQYPASQHFPYGLNGMDGSCCGQMYSAHTATTMFGAFVLFGVLERRWPTWARNVFGVSLKVIMALVAGIIEGTLVVLNYDHYSSDAFIAIVIVMLMVTNDKLALLFSRLNPVRKVAPRPRISLAMEME